MKNDALPGLPIDLQEILHKKVEETLKQAMTCMVCLKDKADARGIHFTNSPDFGVIQEKDKVRFIIYGVCTECVNKLNAKEIIQENLLRRIQSMGTKQSTLDS